MSEFVDFSFRRREEEVQRILQEASPVVIWPCDEGVLVIAANKDGRENRIHAIYDRIVCVTLGGFSAGTILWQDAAFRASAEGYQLSKGDVSCRILIKTTSAVLSDSFQNLRRGPAFGAEAIFAEVAADRDDDYLAHVTFNGFVQTFNTAKLFGRIQKKEGGNVKDDGGKATTIAHERLESLWNPELTIRESLAALRGDQAFSAMFDSVRVEAVTLDRRAVRDEKFDKVLKRLTM